MTQVASRPAAVDPARWPDVAVVPRARLRGRIAAALLDRVGRRLGLLDGPGPTLRLRDPQAFCRRLGRDGLIGFGESYQAGEWDSDRLPEVLTVLAAHADVLVPRRLQWLRRFYVARHPRTDANDRAGARSNIARHYDLSNDLFGLFLDDTMTYSAALFGGPATWDDLARPSTARSTGCSTRPGSVPAPGCWRSAPAGANSRSGPPGAEQWSGR